MPSPASAIRSGSSTYCATRISTSMPHPLEDHAEIGLEQLRFDEPGAVLITEKDAVKCEHLKPDGVWCVVVDFSSTPIRRRGSCDLILRDIGARARDDGVHRRDPGALCVDAVARQAAQGHRRQADDRVGLPADRRRAARARSSSRPTTSASPRRAAGSARASR